MVAHSLAMRNYFMSDFCGIKMLQVKIREVIKSSLLWRIDLNSDQTLIKAA